MRLRSKPSSACTQAFAGAYERPSDAITEMRAATGLPTGVGDTHAQSPHRLQMTLAPGLELPLTAAGDILQPEFA